MPFSKLGLSAEILRAISDQGYSEPTPVQVQAIPPILSGLDVMAGAQTGTGKTAGFTWPILQRLKFHSNTSMSPARHPIRALIVAPTRELAMQVEESVRTYGKYLSLKSTVVFGGVNINPQIKELQSGVDMLVATPGRLLDHVQQKTVNLSKVEILVLDEGDRMLDMGFLPDIKRILALLPAKRQNLLFSATFSDDIKKLADRLLNKPVLIEVGRGNAAADMVAHVVHPVDHNHKRELLSHIIKSQHLRRVLVFTRTKHGANRLANQLQRDGIHCTAIHSNKSQPARIQALADFKSGKVRVLVATDIAARGLDIDELPHVVNFELPHVAGDYVHRIGRTGRAGSSGDAISLVCAEEMEQLKDIERFLKFKLPVKVVPGFEPNQKAARHDSRRPGTAESHASKREHGSIFEPNQKTARHENRRPGTAESHASKREHGSIARIAPASEPPVARQVAAHKPHQPHVKKSMPALFLPPAKTRHSA